MPKLPLGKRGISGLEPNAATIDELKTRVNRLYVYCVLTGFGAASLIAVAAAHYLLDQPSITSLGLALVGSLIAVGLLLAHRWASRPIEKHEARQAALTEAFRDIRYSCSDRVEELFQSSPAARADRLITESLHKITDIRESVAARWEQAYAGMSWWGKATSEPPDLSGMDKKIAELEKAKQRLAATGELQKARALFNNLEERSRRRIDASELAALKSVPQSHLEP
ncbi:hypothetical protein KEU06_26735 [Pseudaminobacter sp. 19-2017]|uniref:Uncharacterized protein n=1 Tax=Pseudaminobacter soli (ex Zhang et al. 2022) TaxID=2831468 RepID=A0A942EBR3_9HYPH|nr:hypothetical protein [Pseudaminobacter soli]MBS3652197.1 hypothetical protein [Pseudaminobacter soli]